MSNWVNESQKIISSTHEIRKDLAEIETGVRGFLITGEKRFLSNFKVARAELDPAFDSLAQMLEGRPNELAAVMRAEAMAKEWISGHLEPAIEQAQARDKSVIPESSRQIMEEITHDLAYLVQSATIMRTKRLEQAQTLARALSGGGVLIAISIGFFLALTARHHILHLTKLYQRSLEERSELLARVTLRSNQLHALSELAVTLNTTVKLSDRLMIITDQARCIIGAELAQTVLAANTGWEEGLRATQFSELYSRWKTEELRICGSNILDLVSAEGKPLRLDNKGLSRIPAWSAFLAKNSDLPPFKGWLAVALKGQDGRNLGVIHLCDKAQGEFTAEDEFILVQIAQLAAVAIENSRLFEAEQDAVRSRDEFLSIASHELKTPLTSLKLQLNLADRILAKTAEFPTREKISGYLRHSARSTNRLTHLIDDMLDISKISAGRLNLHPEFFDLTELVREVVERLAPIATESACSLSVDSKEPTWGNWDRFRLDQVLTNLVSNALKYGAGTPVSICVDQKDGKALVKVKDQGIGISREHHDRIFQRFERVSSIRNISGMGLGLYITKQIVDMHNGQLEVESESGKGATFCLKLPTDNAEKITA